FSAWAFPTASSNTANVASCWRSWAWMSMVSAAPFCAHSKIGWSPRRCAWRNETWGRFPTGCAAARSAGHGIAFTRQMGPFPIQAGWKTGPTGEPMPRRLFALGLALFFLPAFSLRADDAAAPKYQPLVQALRQWLAQEIEEKGIPALSW